MSYGLPGYDSWKTATPPEYERGCGSAFDADFDRLQSRLGTMQLRMERLDKLLANEPAVTKRFAKLARVTRLATLHAESLAREVEHEIDAFLEDGGRR